MPPKINFSVKNALFSTKSYFRGTRFLLLDFTFKDVTRLKKVISLSNFTAVPRVCTIVQTIPLNQDLTRYCLDLQWKSFLGRCLESYIERFIYTKVKTPCKVSRRKLLISISIWLLNNNFHGLSPYGGHHSLLFDQGFPNNPRLQRHLADWNAI